MPSNSVDPTGENAPPQGFARVDIVLIALVIAVALGLRLGYVWSARDNPLFAAPNLDPRLHVEWARAILQGETYQPLPYFRAPLYPVFLAGIYAITGSEFIAPRLVQALLGALS